VDRLSVNDRAVFIADYKTDNVVPERPDQIPPQYVAQLALYRAVLNQLYPSKIVRAALVFTKGPVLLEIRARAMDEALEAALRSELCKNST
jgi:ATP-dependent helicase/nuclease subunit A